MAARTVTAASEQSRIGEVRRQFSADRTASALGTPKALAEITSIASYQHCIILIRYNSRFMLSVTTVYRRVQDERRTSYASEIERRRFPATHIPPRGPLADCRIWISRLRPRDFCAARSSVCRELSSSTLSPLPRKSHVEDETHLMHGIAGELYRCGSRVSKHR